MKQFYKAIIVLIVSCLSLEGVAQNSASTNFGRWTLGTNFGGTYISGDVKSTGGLGYGGYMGYALFYKPYKPLRLDLHGRYLATYTKGLSKELSSTASQNPALNGTYSSYVNYSGTDIYHNYRTHGSEFSLELVLSANRLRERTDIILQGFLGAGFLSYKVNMNQLNSSGLMYDYSGSYTLDDTYESDAYNNRGRQVDIVPTLGYGLGYQIWRHWSILFEHKMTLPLHSHLDGNPFEERNCFYPYDVLHFWGLGIRLNFGGGGSGSKPEPQPQPATPSAGGGTPPPPPSAPPVTPTKPTIIPPQVTILNPSNGHASTYNSTYPLTAEIKYVDSKENVTFWLNGQQTKAFTFNPQTDQFESTINLQDGINQIKIMGTNKAGSDHATAQIEKKLKGYPPTVDVVNPPNNQVQVTKENYQYVVNITRINSTSQLHVTFNGIATNYYSFDPQKGELIFNATLVEGQNKLYVVAENNFGKANDEGIVTYKKPIEVGKPPVVTTISPKGNPYLSSSCNERAKVRVTGVKGKSDIVVRVGRGVLPADKWTYKNGFVEFDIKTDDQLKFFIIGTNDYGQDDDQVFVKCDKQITICHQKPEGTGQETMTIPIKEWPMHQAHGDVKGECVIPPPTLTRVKPANSPYLAANCKASVQYKTTNVNSRSEISITKNGLKFANWTFNNNRISWNDPIERNTTYVVTVETAGGKASASVRIDCEPRITICNPKPEGTGWETITIKEKEWPMYEAKGAYKGECNKQPPSLKLIKPAATPYTSSNNQANVEFKTTNISSKSEITITKNGKNFTNFNFNSGKLTWNDQITKTTKYKVTVTNEGGSKTKTIQINPKKETPSNNNSGGGKNPPKSTTPTPGKTTTPAPNKGKGTSTPNKGGG